MKVVAFPSIVRLAMVQTIRFEPLRPGAVQFWRHGGMLSLVSRETVGCRSRADLIH